MSITELPSGSYRYRKQINGKHIDFTFDHYPTEKEILVAVAENFKDAAPIKTDNLPFEVAAIQYINLKRNVLSPATVREYGRCAGRLSDDFRNLNIYKVTQVDIQTEVNRLSLEHSPKTVRNYHGFIATVIKNFRPDFIIKTTLPQQIKNEPYIPSDDDVIRFLSYINEYRHSYYVLVVLAAYGLRRSEIMAITPEDLDGNTLSITKALVQDENKEWVIKTTKTTRSNRTIEIPPDIANEIRQNGCAFSGNPSGIKKVIDTACKKLDIPHFTLHKLRHYFASKLLSENVDIITVMSLGGWSSTAMLQKHYAHALEAKKKSAVQIIGRVTSIEGCRDNS